MRRVLEGKLRATFLAWFLAGPMVAWSEDWNGRLNYTGFAGDDLGRLLQGEVLGKRATLSRMPNAMAVETCFLKPVPLEQAAAALMNWDPSQFPDLGVQLHRPVSSPARPEDFRGLRLSPDSAANRALLERSAALAGGALVKLVSREEVEWFKKHQHEPALAWRQVLLNRASRYQASGIKEMPAFEGVRPPFRLQASWQQLVSLTPEVTRRFIDVLQIALNDPNKRLEGSLHKVYWETLTVQGETTYLLGAIHQVPTEESIRTADLQFYVSSQFASALILHEMWPVSWEGRPATLVWRGDYVLLPEAITSQGIERMASENLLLQEVRRAVTAFIQGTR